MGLTEKERWPTTGSEETFRALSAEGMIKAGFNIDSCTWAEFEAYRDQCDEEDEENAEAEEALEAEVKENERTR